MINSSTEKKISIFFKSLHVAFIPGSSSSKILTCSWIAYLHTCVKVTVFKENFTLGTDECGLASY